MLISELIKELQERLEIFGDSPVIFRAYLDDDDIDIEQAYYDDDANKMVLSDINLF